MIHIVDYGIGNIGSIANMINHIGGECIITNNLVELAASEKLILPGVGHFDRGMNMLKELGLVDILNKKAIQEKCPILGICLGAQMMTQSSEEGKEKGLGWFNADVLKFKSDGNMKIPHMGWNDVHVAKANRLIDVEIHKSQRFYFVHSYYMKSNNPKDILFTSMYGNSFVSALNKENIYAVQFHPEKSHKYGMELFKNFLKL